MPHTNSDMKLYYITYSLICHPISLWQRGVKPPVLQAKDLLKIRLLILQPNAKFVTISRDPAYN